MDAPNVVLWMHGNKYIRNFFNSVSNMMSLIQLLMHRIRYYGSCDRMFLADVIHQLILNCNISVIFASMISMLFNF